MSAEPEPSDQYNDDYYETREIIVDPKQEPLRIDKFLMTRLQSSRNRVQNAIKAGSILVDGKEVKPNHKVKPGQHLSIVIPRPYGEEGTLIPEDIPLDIRYEDDDLLVVHKPAGMVVHPGVGNWTGTLVNGLAYHFGEDLPVLEGNARNRVGLVHRIDKNTSGLLVVAKSDLAMSSLAKQFFDHTIERTYYALVWGDVEEDKGTIETFIGRDERFRKKFTTYPEDEGKGKWAITHYEVVERFYYVTLVKCNLETGRTHQIRVHMKHLGHPLFSDDTYGGNRILKGTIYSKYKQFVEQVFTAMPRQALHAKSLGFTHPVTKEFMLMEAELPEDFATAVDMWRKYVAQRAQDKGIR